MSQLKRQIYRKLKAEQNIRDFYSVNVPWKVGEKEYGFFTFQFDVHNGPRRLKSWEDSWARSLPDMFINSKPCELTINENGMELFCKWLQDAGLVSE